MPLKSLLHPGIHNRLLLETIVGMNNPFPDEFLRRLGKSGDAFTLHPSFSRLV
jgi:hypothetical protein